MISPKVLDKHLFLLEYVPSISTCLLVALLFIIQNLQYEKKEQQQQLAYLTSLFSNEQQLDQELFAKQSKSLLLTGNYQSIRLLDQKKNPLAHFGMPIEQNVQSLIQHGKTHWQLNDKNHYLIPVTTKSAPPYWVHVTRDISHLELWIYRSLLLLITSLLIAMGSLYFLGRKIRKKIKRENKLIEEALDKLKNEEYGYLLEENSVSIFNPLSYKINDLSLSLKQLMQKMQHTIDQSVRDLEETLETVEIQNIEIDLARKNAIKANQAKSEFLASTSHEIRTPLNGILGFTNLMRKTQLSAQQEEYLETIEDSAQVLLLNINDIIDFSRLEIGKLNLEYKPIYLRELIKESQKYIVTHSNLKDVTLDTETKQSIPNKLLGDPLRFKQVYTNLLSNALSLCQSHKITTSLDIKSTDENQTQLKVELICHGENIEIRELQTAQTLLRSADPAHEKLTNKNHMGLVIAKGLVERMNGEIGLSTRENETVFWFTVLLGKPNIDTQTIPTKSHISVLVVDDNHSNRRLICELLSDMSVQVSSVGSGEEAITLCKKQDFSLILMDIQMPGLNGFETTQAIREIEEKDKRTPIVALTAHAVEEAKAQLLLSGLDDFVSKPIGETELKELLNRWASYSVNTEKVEEQSLRTTSNTSKQTERSEASHKKPVDISESLNLAKGKADLAKDMLTMLIQSLKQDIPKVKRLWSEKKYREAQEIIHQIHGGACYCGVPELLSSSKALDKALKDLQFDRCGPLYESFIFACDELLLWEEEHDIEILFSATGTMN